MLKRNFIRSCLGLILLAGCLGTAQAGITLGGTRVISPGENKEASIRIRNGDSDVLVQSWLESTTSTDELPFALSPPLARLNANQQQLLRIMYEGRGMPSDRESVFWLNVQEIPKKAEGQNVLQLAVHQRIKVFYRPKGLEGRASEAPAQLQWQLNSAGTSLSVKNPSPYHVSMSDLQIKNNNQTEVLNAPMIEPGNVMTFPLKKANLATGSTLRIRVVNDYGSVEEWTAALAPGQSVGATMVTR